jgi:Na+/glutamate symporter
VIRAFEVPNMNNALFAVFLTIVVASPALGQDYMQMATDSGICGDAPVAAATFVAETNSISVTCQEDVTGFLPLIGGLGPAALAGIAVVLAAAGGGSGPSDTQ